MAKTAQVVAFEAHYSIKNTVTKFIKFIQFYTIVVKVMFHISKTNWVEILLQEKEEGGGGAEKYLTFLFPGREGGGVGRAGVHPLFLEGTAESTWKFWSTTSRKRVANKIGSIFRFIFVFTKEERQQLSDFKVQRRGDRYETKSAYAGDF